MNKCGCCRDEGRGEVYMCHQHEQLEDDKADLAKDVAETARQMVLMNSDVWSAEAADRVYEAVLAALL